MATQADFERAQARVETYEGGWSNHAADPGGLTKWGITLATLKSLWRDFTGDGRVDAADLRAMTPAQARDIYLREYWQRSNCPALPAPLAFLVHDSAVNQGVGRAGQCLQLALGMTGSAVDGEIGPVTAARANARWAFDPVGLMVEFQARRVVHYGGLSIFRTFGLGWSRRATDGLAYAVAWHLGAPHAGA